MSKVNKGDVLGNWMTLTYQQKLHYLYGYLSEADLDDCFEYELENAIETATHDDDSLEDVLVDEMKAIDSYKTLDLNKPDLIVEVTVHKEEL